MSSPIDPVPSWESIDKGFITDVLSSLNSKNSFDEMLYSSEFIIFKPGPSYLSRLDSTYKLLSLSHSLYGALFLSFSSICFSEYISPVSVLIAITPPGATLPLKVIFSSFVGLIPVSDAIEIILS